MTRVPGSTQGRGPRSTPPAAAPAPQPLLARVCRGRAARIAWAAAAALLFLAAPPVVAQSKTGTSIGQFVLIEPSARIAAMGNAGVALCDGIQAAYYNPAAFGLIDGPQVQLTHSNWLADIGYEYAAAAYPLRQWGTLFGSLTALNSGDIQVRTVEEPLGTGERYDVSDVALGLGFGRSFTDRFAAGLQVNYLHESIWNSSLETVTLSMGTIYRVSEDGLRIGASLSNFGTQAAYSGGNLVLQYDQDPTRYGDNSALPGRRATDSFAVPILFRLGLAQGLAAGPQGRVLLTLDAFHASYNTESLSAGAEWSWKDIFALRAGYQNLYQEDSEVGLALGAGLKGSLGEQTFSFDYAWADQGLLDETHRMTFVITF